MTTNQKRERKDWALLIFIIPIGILLLLFVGQLAARLVPFWSANVGMNSNLEPDADAARPFALLEPILPQILTPLAWAETYLTPGAEISFPPFLTFDPTATPTPTVATATATEATPTQTATTSSTPVPTSTTGTAPPSTGTKPPDDSSTPPPTTPPPTTPPPTTPPPTTPPPTTPPPTTPPPTTPPPTDITSTPDPSYTLVTPPPELGEGTPPDNLGPNSNNIGTILDGTYVVISLNVIVGMPDGNYDLAFYEYDYKKQGFINLDWIIVGISIYADGHEYYEVFNWSNGTPDVNSNVGDVAAATGTEIDNQSISTTELYDPDGAGGPSPQTGVLIDVDTASSNPPAGEYQFVVLISPIGGDVPAQAAQVDSVQTVEVPIPTPTP